MSEMKIVKTNKMNENYVCERCLEKKQQQQQHHILQ